MTLEEKAKDYANKWLWAVKDLEIEHKTDPKPEYIRIEEAYLAGAKENGVVWHDLEKDPTDLPKGYAENTKFLCSVKGETLFLIRYGSFWQGNFEVIAWCEMPTFDKE